MKLPHERSLVTVLAQLAWESVRTIQRYVVLKRPETMTEGTLAGEQRATSWNAGWTLGERGLEIRGAGGYVIKIWRIDNRVTVDAQTVASLLIGGY